MANAGSTPDGINRRCPLAYTSNTAPSTNCGNRCTMNTERMVVIDTLGAGWYTLQIVRLKYEVIRARSIANTLDLRPVRMN